MRGGLDPELTAVRLGLKPVVRVAVEPARRAEAERRLRDAGLAVVSSRRGALLQGSVYWLLYASSRDRSARAVRDLEEPVLPGSPEVDPRERRERHRALGRGLGYPLCCVDAFLERLERGVGVRRGGTAVEGVEDWVAFAEAHSAAAYWGVNTCRNREALWLVPWYPCRFDCAATGRYAQVLFDHLHRRHPEDAEALREALRGTFVLAPDGGRARVERDAEGVIVQSEALPWHGASAPACVGKRCVPGGEVAGLGGERTLLRWQDFTAEEPR